MTPKEFLKMELEMGIGFHNPEFIELANQTTLQLKDYPIQSVLDYGCGTGVYSEAFRKQNKEVFAFDIWDEHIEYVKQNAPEVKIVDKPLTTDLMCFIEVAEHMTDKQLKALFKKIKPKYILFSSTPNITENDEEWGHINIKQPNEWDELFLNLGYEKQRDMEHPTKWAKLYQIV